MTRLAAIVFAFGVIACGGPPGPAGSNGAAGKDGVDGTNGSNGENGDNGEDGRSALLDLDEEAPGTNCPLGGTRVRAGIDANGNGVLDEAEVTTTSYVCAGADGASGENGSAGSDAVVRTDVEEPGANCEDGGIRISSGTDENGNGTLDDPEVTATEYLCEHAPPPPVVETTILADDFESGITGWVRSGGSTDALLTTPTASSPWTDYASEGSTGLALDEIERYSFDLPATSVGHFTAYFFDTSTDTQARALLLVQGTQGRVDLGVRAAGDGDLTHYVFSTQFGSWQPSTVPRRTGWHRVDVISDGTSCRGYIDEQLVFETIREGMRQIVAVAVDQEDLLTGFMVDDVSFVRFE